MSHSELYPDFVNVSQNPFSWQVDVIVHGTLSKVQKVFRGKAAKFARSKMEEGDHWLKKGKLDKALSSINLAVVRAPTKGFGSGTEDSKIAALSLWIRSEILLLTSEFQLCLYDIQLAIKYHLPSNLKSEAYYRMGLCYLNLGEKKKGLVSINVAKFCGDSSMQKNCLEIVQNVDNILKPPTTKIPPPFLPNGSTELLGLSDSVKLCSNNEFGRHIKATRQISVGETIAFEDPYVSALFVEKHGTHCLHCFTRLKAPIPCPDCAGVAFCSNKCMNEGLTYHRWECQYLELEIGSGMSALSHLALRIVTQQSLDYFKAATNETHIYQKVLKLEGHKQNRDGIDLLHRTLMSLFLLQILRHSGYFTSNKKGKDLSTPYPSNSYNEYSIGRLSEDEMYIGCLLLHHLLVLQYNSHEIYETVVPRKHLYSQGKTSYIALGLYLNSSMLNHQCQPTLARLFHGKTIVLKAQHPIGIGEEVSENYGPIFTMRTKEQRQQVLSGRYLFDCTCQACILNWPKLESMSPDKAYFRCKQDNCSGTIQEKGICLLCGCKELVEEEKLLLHSYQDDWYNGAELMKIGKYDEAEEIIIQYINVMWTLVCQPSKNMCLAMEALRTIWANKFGNKAVLEL